MVSKKFNKSSLKARAFGVIAAFALSIMAFSNTVFADSTKVNLETGKNAVKTSEEVKVVVNWEKPAQLASFVVKYDASMLKFKNASIAGDFVTTKTGEVKVNWFVANAFASIERITLNFEALKAGSTEVKLSVDSITDPYLEKFDLEKGAMAKTIKIEAKNSTSTASTVSKKKEETKKQDTKKQTPAKNKLPSSGPTDMVAIAIIAGLATALTAKSLEKRF